MRKKTGRWYWRCERRTTNVGHYNADYEECGSHSKRGFRTEEACRKAALKHDQVCFYNKPWDNRLGGGVRVWHEIKACKKNR